ncbi:MAG: DEAD/DEAH box helicase [Deltaproteobacteria bacterium]
MRTLKDKLSHLTYQQATKLLGAQGKELLMAGGKFDIDVFEQVTLDDESFQLKLEGSIVDIRLDSLKHQRIQMTCSTCPVICDHQGAALSLILEEKMALGLAAPPPERVPVESLSEAELIDQAMSDRKERALTEKMRLVSMNPHELWTDYVITSQVSGKSYRIALRGWKPGESYCSCPDFRKNTLGTCKHIMFSLEIVRKKFNKQMRETPAEIKEICFYLQYGEETQLKMLMPEILGSVVLKRLLPLKGKPIENMKDLISRIRHVENAGISVTVYPDAEEYINRRLFQDRMADEVADIRKDPANHPLRKTLLKTELLPYQLDGIAFAAGAGRAVLADDMGLGKTIQGIGLAELLSRQASITKVLIICPASLKAQWRIEIKRFSHRSSCLILGAVKDRQAQYVNDSFFTICNYEQVMRDFLSIEKVSWDLIILDEGQRIKNWEAKTSRVIKSLRSRFALVLSGTPLENRIDDLFSVVEFIDDRRLGPAFKFFNRHRMVDEKGKLLGYKNLDELRERLKPILLRRTRASVIKDLPPRTTQVIRITPTDEQLGVEIAHRKIIQIILQKKFISEMDLLRLQKALLMCRLCANSTFLVDKQTPGYSSKLKELDSLLEQLFAEDDRKIVLFSEWTGMLDMIEPLLEAQKLNYVRLDGSVPQKLRQGLVQQFQGNPECKLFITTNAGSTGLNLQAANTVINVDLPWNPAVLEQRIGRAHRMGQKRPVQVFLLVTVDTLEESLLTTLSTKHELALAVLDPDADITQVNMTTGIEELKRRLEILLGAKPEAAEDESMKAQVERQATVLVKKEKVATAGGQLVGAAFAFIGEMFSSADETEKIVSLTEAFRSKLNECMEKNDDGSLSMTIRMPDDTFVQNMARSLAQMVAGGQ